MRSFRFTIRHGFAASLVLHSAILLPFLVPLSETEPEEDETLVVHLEGVESDDQAELRVQQQAPSIAGREESKPERTKVAQAGEQPRTDATSDITEPTAGKSTEKPAPPQKARPGAQYDFAGTIGGDDQQIARTLRQREEREDQALRFYVRALSKRVQSKLVYPEEGRQDGWQGVTTVTFTILPNGNLRADSLKVVSSSGQPKLDESALKTIRASAPFAPPPKEITPTIGVDYGRKR
jgi:periplasmic protein TonB